MSIQTDVSTHGGKITFQETENRCTAKTRKSRITKEKREGGNKTSEPTMEKILNFAHQTERIQKQRIRLQSQGALPTEASSSDKMKSCRNSV